MPLAPDVRAANAPEIGAQQNAVQERELLRGLGKTIRLRPDGDDLDGAQSQDRARSTRLAWTCRLSEATGRRPSNRMSDPLAPDIVAGQDGKTHEVLCLNTMVVGDRFIGGRFRTQ